jgi:hypothetical protein
MIWNMWMIRYVSFAYSKPHWEQVVPIPINYRDKAKHRGDRLPVSWVFRLIKAFYLIVNEDKVKPRDMPLALSPDVTLHPDQQFFRPVVSRNISERGTRIPERRSTSSRSRDFRYSTIDTLPGRCKCRMSTSRAFMRRNNPRKSDSFPLLAQNQNRDIAKERYPRTVPRESARNGDNGR